MAIDSHTNFKVSFMNAMRTFFSKFQKNERGVTAIEYGLIAIAMAGLLTVVFSGTNSIPAKLGTAFHTIASDIGGAASGASATYKAGTN
jgi:pilus assembly protein Flp/PilA